MSLGDVALQGLLDGAQKIYLQHRLGKKIDGTRLHGANRHRNITMARDEDDRYCAPLNAKARLQLEAIDAAPERGVIIDASRATLEACVAAGEGAQDASDRFVRAIRAWRTL